jgi:hypothetical protein
LLLMTARDEPIQTLAPAAPQSNVQKHCNSCVKKSPGPVSFSDDSEATMATTTTRTTMALIAISCLSADTTAAGADVQPALDLITRQFGSAAAAAFTLSINSDPTAPCTTSSVDGVRGAGARVAAAPCYAIEQGADNKVMVSASSMAELTYGIGRYTRFQCGLTVGWARGGNSHANVPGLQWPCHANATHASEVSPEVGARVVK